MFTWYVIAWQDGHMICYSMTIWSHISHMIGQHDNMVIWYGSMATWIVTWYDLTLLTTHACDKRVPRDGSQLNMSPSADISNAMVFNCSRQFPVGNNSLFIVGELDVANSWESSRTLEMTGPESLILSRLGCEMIETAWTNLITGLIYDYID